MRWGVHRKVRWSSMTGVLGAAALVAAVGAPAAASAAGHKGAATKSSSGVAYAKKQVAKYSKPYKAKPTAGPPITGVAALQGKTVWYVPILETVPFFAEAATGMKDALAHLGMNFQECNAQATPSGAVACINQAVSSGAGAIVTNAFPQGFAASAIANAEAHNIPVVLGGDGFTKGNDKLAYVTLGYPHAQKLAADWVTATSKGNAHVLYVEITDSTVSENYATQGALPEFKKRCPKCKVTVVKTETVDLSSLPSLVSSSLTDHPTIDYVFPEFDVDVTEAIAGIVSNTHTTPIQVASVEGLLSAMQRVAKGNLQHVDVVSNGNESGWAMVDQALRMMKGMPTVDNYHCGLRVVTSANVHKTHLTPAAQNTGTWVGPTTYTKYFESLWK